MADVGLIGLAVMGQNLALNINDHGYSVVVYNRTAGKTREFLDGGTDRQTLTGAFTVKDFARQLDRPRKIILMVKAGTPVDNTIEELLPFLSPGDIIMDGGNSMFEDTRRRMSALKDKGILFMGTGISGGEEGARKGPSIMPGGDPEAWPHMEFLLKDIAAKTSDGAPCCEWIGPGGAGHYVKMVHNGIEYGDMQIIGETYHLMKQLLRMSNTEMADAFARWNKGELDSYLIEITAAILKHRDGSGQELVDSVLDAAGQKGTGKWTVISALDQGQPMTLISEAVFARALSALKEERVFASGILAAGTGFGPSGDDRATPADGDLTGNGGIAKGFEVTLEHLAKALLASKIVSYAQGFMLLKEASERYGWDLDFAVIPRLWEGGCIIRSRFLTFITAAYRNNPRLQNLLLDDYFSKTLRECLPSWRLAAIAAVSSGIPVPAMSSALSFYDGYRSPWLPANLLQAQRDFFGAHTYERTDRPRGEFFHTVW